MRKVIFIAFAAVAAAVVLPFVAMLAFETVDTLVRGCSEGEKRVFREFSQYGGRQLEPEYSGSNGCFVTFTTEDPSESVRTYYKEQLAARGWKLDSPPPVEAAEGQSEAGALSAGRGRYGYQALLESTRSGTSVVIYVIERED